MIAVVIAFLAVMLIAALLAGMETGLYSIERLRLEVGAARGDRSATRLLALATNPAPAVCALLIAINVAHYALAYFADEMMGWLVAEQRTVVRKVLDTLLLGPVLFVFGDLLPKNVFMRAPTGLMRTFQPALSLLSAVLRPITLPLVKLAAPKEAEESELEAASIFDRGSIHYLLTVDDEGAGLTAPQRAVAERVLALRNLRVQDRLIPLPKVSAVPAGAAAADIVAEGARSGHSRLPVYTGDRRRFAGYVNVIDAAIAGPGFVLSEHMHELPEVPCDLPVTAALYRLQRLGRPIASVLSPDGRTALGIIAVSDIVSALFRV